MPDIVVATRNQGKLKEVRAVLNDLDCDILSLNNISFSGDIEETGTTYLENAGIKSSLVARTCGKITLADDSGLEIDALNGEPGLHSARFGGEEMGQRAKNELVLRLMESVPTEQRTARFRCVISISLPGGEEFHCEGACEGFITKLPSGTRGFGYDPIFRLPEFGKTMAELDSAQKNRISHRAKALFKAREILTLIL